jgi:predicted adenine nucleotide alpha hydrolase (AANH) superfamily ATPase
MHKKLLLHSCCAPCFGYVHELLSPEYNITAYFFNPNIAPKNEYELRLSEIERYCIKLNIPFFQGKYSIKEWTSQVKDYRFLGERSERCHICIELRLRKTFEFAKKNGYDTVTTTLSISPHKDSDMINSTGRKLSEEFTIKFLESDFKKNDGFKRSLEISAEQDFYRQNYCGCIYSKLERNRKSLWYKTIKKRAGISCPY